jgi:formylglycine-generating enzyme required for sulfatase activity
MKIPTSPKFLVLTLALGGLSAQIASALTMETVPVGNPGNVPDPVTNRGAVAYDYNIGKYEVTLNQYTEFLNAVAATDTYDLYDTQMAATPYVQGIARAGAPGSYTYSVIGSGNRPVTFVTWYDAARFANWLQNGQPTGLQEAGTTETGAYTLTGNTGLIDRNTNWVYGVPSNDEWYKAAYHQPAAQGGDTDDYWALPTRSNSTPNSRNGSDTDPFSANFLRDDGIDNGYNGGYAVTQSPVFDGSLNHLTDVGAFSVAGSFYGTLDQAGNVYEWTEALVSGFGIRRGGAWALTGEWMRSDLFDFQSRGQGSNSLGFRIVMNPSLAPPALNFSQSGNTLTFTWAGNFKLQFQNNGLLSTGWEDYPGGGSSPVIHNIDPLIPSAFFRLSSP